MRAASVDEPDIANGAGIRRDGRGTDRSEGIPCVANDRRATTSAQVTFLWSRLPSWDPCGVNGLRARGGVLSQRPACEKR